MHVHNSFALAIQIPDIEPPRSSPHHTPSPNRSGGMLPCILPRSQCPASSTARQMCVEIEGAVESAAKIKLRQSPTAKCSRCSVRWRSVFNRVIAGVVIRMAKRARAGSSHSFLCTTTAAHSLSPSPRPKTGSQSGAEPPHLRHQSQQKRGKNNKPGT